MDLKLAIENLLVSRGIEVTYHRKKKANPISLDFTFRILG